MPATMKNSPGDSQGFFVPLVIRSQLFPKGGTNRVLCTSIIIYILYAETGRFAHNMFLFYLEAERHWLFTVILALGL